MKPLQLTTILLILALAVNAQVDKNAIIGVWQTQSKDAQLTIYSDSNIYFGKINWLKNPGKDTENPNPTLRSRDLVGTVILKDFIFNEKDKWENGKIYDPSGGKTYSCNMKLKNNNTLEIRGYIGVSLIGKTEVWTRVL